MYVLSNVYIFCLKHGGAEPWGAPTPPLCTLLLLLSYFDIS